MNPMDNISDNRKNTTFTDNTFNNICVDTCITKQGPSGECDDGQSFIKITDENNLVDNKIDVINESKNDFFPLPPNHHKKINLIKNLNDVYNQANNNSNSKNNISTLDPKIEPKWTKFTQTPGCTPCTCICLLFAILFITISATSAIYFALRFYDGKIPRDQVFKGQFTVTRGDSYNIELEKRSSHEFKEHAKGYKIRLDKAYNSSHISGAFLRSEIIAFEKVSETGLDDLIVHFNLIFSPHKKPNLNSADVYLVLAEEIANKHNNAFEDLSIDLNSLKIQKRSSSFSLLSSPSSSSISLYSPSYVSTFPTSALLFENQNPWETNGFPGLLEGFSYSHTPRYRKCSPISISFCLTLSYNKTSYPNIVGHWNITALEKSILNYRQIIDAECYPLAREFVCRIIQPECEQDQMIWPCKEYCEDFMKSCGQWISSTMIKFITCDKFPTNGTIMKEDIISEFNQDNRLKHMETSIIDDIWQKRKHLPKCRSKPGCINSIKARGREHHVCDLIIDCPDKSDELNCDNCSPNRINSLICGDGQCVDKEKRCDSRVDCNNGRDEYNCLFLSETLDTVVPTKSSGFLFSSFKGSDAKVCASKLPNIGSISKKSNILLKSFGSIVCNQLGFSEVTQIKVRGDHTTTDLFVEITDVLNNSLRIIQTPCLSRQILHMTCTTFICGHNLMFISPEKRNHITSKKTKWNQYSNLDQETGLFRAIDGDIPWHISIQYKAHLICDGSLIHPQWIIVPTFCLSSIVSGNDILITGGSVRFKFKSPLFSEQRKMIALINSPPDLKVNISLIRVDNSFNLSDYIKPICNDENNARKLIELYTAECYTTLWDLKRDQLLFTRASIVDNEQCFFENDSHTICAKLIGCKSCFPTGPLFCSISYNPFKWYLIGIQYGFESRNELDKFNKTRIQRFFKISSVHHWIQEVIQSFQPSLSYEQRDDYRLSSYQMDVT